jgi:hypothetical protein
MIVGCLAVFYISFLSYVNPKRGVIFKATIIVILVKIMISPYTPVMAYFAVLYQGAFGELLYSFKRIKTISCFILSIITALFSSLQKVITLSLFFGLTLWDSIDKFLNYVSGELFINTIFKSEVSFSYYIILAYVLIHLTAGILMAFIILNFLKNFPDLINNPDFKLEINKNIKVKQLSLKKKKFKFSKILFIIFLITILLFSYISPEKFGLNSHSILLMIFRALLIFIIWFKVLSPLIINMFRKIINKKNNKYSDSISKVLIFEPYIRNLIPQAWKKSNPRKRTARLIYFMKLIIINFLSYAPETERTN